MPLDSVEDYDRLGEHLALIDAPLAAFAAKHGYTVYPRRSGGRYPNRRITQNGLILRSIHITMDDMPTGWTLRSFLSRYSIHCVGRYVD